MNTRDIKYSNYMELSKDDIVEIINTNPKTDLQVFSDGDDTESILLFTVKPLHKLVESVDAKELDLLDMPININNIKPTLSELKVLPTSSKHLVLLTSDYGRKRLTNILVVNLVIQTNISAVSF